MPTRRPGTSPSAAAASIRYSKPFLRTRRPAVKMNGASPMPSSRRTAARTSALGAKRSRVDAVGHGLDALSRRAPSSNGSLAKVVAAGRDPAGAVERVFRAAPGDGAPFGDEHVGSVETHDERQAAGRGGRDDAVRNDPVCVKNRRVGTSPRPAAPSDSPTRTRSAPSPTPRRRSAVSALSPLA